MNDTKKDALTSTVLQEALLNMPLRVILECEAPSSSQQNPRPASTLDFSGRSSTAHGSEASRTRAQRASLR